MKLPLCITLMIFSLLLVMFANTIESRKELNDHWWKNRMEDESLPISKPLFPGGEKPFIKDTEHEPNTDNALLGYTMKQSSPIFFQKKPGSIKDIEPQPIKLEPSTDNALLGYTMKQSSPIFFQKKPASIQDIESQPIELEPSTDNALLGYTMERSSPKFFQKKPAFIKDVEPQSMELEPRTDNALLGYTIERSSPKFFQKKPTSIKDIEPQPIEIEPSTDNALLGYTMERSSPTFFQKKPASIKDIEPQPIELEPSTENALLGYKMERSSPTSLKNPIIRMVTGHGSHETNPMEHNMKDMLYFTFNDLKPGKKIPFYLHQNDPLTTPSLTKESADSIPFSLKQLPQILNFFSFPPSSPQAQVVENALRLCERKPVEGETKFCATSMKSMVDFVSSALGCDAKSSSVKYLATTLLTKSITNLQNYTLLQMPNEIKVSKYFACHALRYPYLIRYCHSRFGYTKLLQFPMEGENGDRVQALAVCHMETSDWNPKHPSFKVLNTKPGTFPICHIMPLTDLIWLPISTST